MYISKDQLQVSCIVLLYIGSGICQPLLMIVCKQSGLANPNAQLYMLFYYLGPSLLIFFFNNNSNNNRIKQKQKYTTTITHNQQQYRGCCCCCCNDISYIVIIKACLIAIFDIIAQTFNYTGAIYAGATIFAIIYSSVTIWTAIFSYFLLSRSISYTQCIAIFIVMIGLCITSLDSSHVTTSSTSSSSTVLRGTIYILFGSCMHGATYVFSESIMMNHMNHNNKQYDSDDDTETSSILQQEQQQQQNYYHLPKRTVLTFIENSSIQGLVACIGLFIWQIVYTIPHYSIVLYEPMYTAGTSILQAIIILVSFSIINLFHSISFFYIIAYYPGGSTSAGMMKGLQAVLVFIVAHYLFCNNQNHNNSTDTRINEDTNNVCFTKIKFISLITVISGVTLFRCSIPNTTTIATTTNATTTSNNTNTTTTKYNNNKLNYTSISDTSDIVD